MMSKSVTGRSIYMTSKSFWQKIHQMNPFSCKQYGRIPSAFWIFFSPCESWEGCWIYYAQRRVRFIAICPINGFITFLRGLWVRKWGNIKRFLLCTHARDPFRHDKRLFLGGLKYFASISEVDFRGFKTLLICWRVLKSSMKHILQSDNRV